MIKEEIKKANIEAMKAKDAVARAIYSVILNKIMLAEVKLRGTNNTLQDADILSILQKTSKELAEEKDGYKKVGNTVKFAEIEKQESLVAKFLPKELSEAEIKAEILRLEDKSVGSVMKHFKANFNGVCDMAVVKRVLDELLK